MDRDRREDEGQYYPGGKVIPATPQHGGGGSMPLDNTVTEGSENPVKSSGIWAWVKSLLPSWLTSDYTEPATVASVDLKADEYAPSFCTVTYDGVTYTDWTLVDGPRTMLQVNVSGTPTTVALFNSATGVFVSGTALFDGDAGVAGVKPTVRDGVARKSDIKDPSWSDITGKPDTFPPSAHSHTNDSWFTTAIEAVKTWASGAFAAITHSHLTDNWFTSALGGKLDSAYYDRITGETNRFEWGEGGFRVTNGEEGYISWHREDGLIVNFTHEGLGIRIAPEGLLSFWIKGRYHECELPRSNGTLALISDILQLCRPFDTTKSGGYAVGEFCSYLDGTTLKLYQCTVAHTGAWNAAHFAERDVSALFSSANTALMGVVRYAFNADGTIKDRAINAITYAGGALPNFPAQVSGYARDFLLNVTATATASDISLPESGATSVGDALAFTAGKTYLVAITEIAAKKYYIRIIDTTPQNA